MPIDRVNRPSQPFGERDPAVIRTQIHQHPALQFTHPLPYGAIMHDGGVQFVVFSRSATAMRLLLYNRPEDPEPAEVIEFDRDSRSLGRHLEHFCAGAGGRATVPFSGRRAV